MRATSPRPCGDPSTRSSDSLPQDDRKRAIRFARSSNSLAQNDMKEANHVARDDTRESFFRRLEVTDGVGTALGAGALHVLTFHRFFFVLVSAHHATEWGHGRGRHRLSSPFLQFSAVDFPPRVAKPAWQCRKHPGRELKKTSACFMLSLPWLEPLSSWPHELSSSSVSTPRGPRQSLRGLPTLAGPPSAP